MQLRELGIPFNQITFDVFNCMNVDMAAMEMKKGNLVILLN